MTSPTPPRVPDVVLVFTGGALGSVARYGVGVTFASGGTQDGVRVVSGLAAVPWSTLLVNVLGAVAIGVLVGVLGATRSGPATERSRRIRLALGTGLLGGFTTYSAFALETTELVCAGDAAVGVGYALVTVVLGLLGAALGLWGGGRLGRTLGSHPRSGQPAGEPS